MNAAKSQVETPGVPVELESGFLNDGGIELFSTPRCLDSMLPITRLLLLYIDIKIVAFEKDAAKVETSGH